MDETLRVPLWTLGSLAAGALLLAWLALLLRQDRGVVDVDSTPRAPRSPLQPVSRPLSPGPQAEVHAALAAGKKIQAIKLYRQATGVSLKEAKDAVDAMA